jgi:succinate-semialdehyde dehydrogenase/glutarate-semialdehyde dehydrogenase
MLQQINKSSLVRNQCYVNGAWIEAKSGSKYDVTNPATKERLTSVPSLSVTEVEEAIQAAHEAFQSWSKVDAASRASYLKKWHQLILDNADDLAKLLTLEQGKPLAEAKGEINYGASFIEWFAEEARRVYGDIIPGHQANKRIIVLKQPIGVVGAITPWNFPNAMITRKIAPALAAGCTVIIKPSEDTPLSALALAALAEEAGFPKGVINVITSSNPKEVGTTICNSKLVKKISFTGSTNVGKWLMENSASTLKKLSLELGGNAPFIVFEDADLNKAVEGAIASKYRNAGQTCVCANRVFVHEKLYDSFLDKFSEAVKQQKVGNGLDETVSVGPLINEAALQKVQRLVHDAVSLGARVTTGGKAHSLGKTYYEPTVLANVTENMGFAEEEIFGPVAPVYKFKSDEEVIKMANNTNAGLAAYFYANDLSRVWKVAEALEYGIVGINTGMISTTVAPFGGIKESGFGREGSKYGIDEYITLKYLCMEV